jgi:hypothetical protein
MSDENLYINIDDENIEGTLKTYMSGKRSCLPYTDPEGNHFYVRVSVPEERNRNFNTFREKVQKMTQLYTKETFLEAPDGVYTWILGNNGFFAVKVQSRLELGTLHKQIALASDTRQVRVAGECAKTGLDIAFNLQSGTYSLPMSRVRENANKILLSRAKNVFEDMGFKKITPLLTANSFITEVQVPVSYRELKAYVDAGFEVILARTLEECGGTSVLEGQIATQKLLIKQYDDNFEKMKAKYDDFMKKAEELTGDAKAKMERRAAIFKPKEEERERYVNEVIRLENELKKLKSGYIILSGGGKRSRRGSTKRRRHRKGTRKI